MICLMAINLSPSSGPSPAVRVARSTCLLQSCWQPSSQGCTADHNEAGTGRYSSDRKRRKAARIESTPPKSLLLLPFQICIITARVEGDRHVPVTAITPEPAVIAVESRL